jgi:hypothetical protein
MYQASCFQLTLRQHISRRRGAIVPVIHVEIFSVNIYAKGGPALLIAFSSFGDVGNVAVKIDRCLPSNLSKQLTRKYDTVSCAPLISIAVIPDSTAIICIKSMAEVCSQRQFSCGGATYGARYGNGKMPPL